MKGTHVMTATARKVYTMGSVDNILRCYYLATPEQVQSGYDWYDNANAFAHTLASYGGITFEQSCDLIAANSINTPWDRNVILAWHHATNGLAHPRTMKATVRLIQRILNGERLHDVVSADARKARSFSANIGGDLNVATIDRWAHRIWTGLADCVCTKVRKDGTRVHGCGHVPNGREYERVAADYAAAGAAVHVPVAVLQAITWIVLRGKAD
jgi:hypothetical protein